MASSMEFVEYAAEQLSGAGEITSRKMFGEFGLYCNGKFFGLICDNQLFVKTTEAGKNVLPGLREAAPYEGAKPHFLIEQLENRELLAQFLVQTCAELPMQKPRKKKKES